MFKILIFIVLFTNTLTSDSCNSDLLNLHNYANNLERNNSSFKEENDKSKCSIIISHSFLAVNRGFISDQNYEISVVCPKQSNKHHVTLALFDFQKFSSFGKFKGGLQFSCKNGNVQGVAVYSNSTTSTENSLETTPSLLKTVWTTPLDDNVRCFTFSGMIKNGFEETQYIHKRICKNSGCYQIFNDSERVVSLEEIGPTSCWLFFMVLPEKQLKLQILSYQHTNQSVDCFGLMMSTNETEINFTGQIRFCQNISQANATDLYSKDYGSDPIIARYHVLANEKLFLQFRYFNTKLKHGCNETFLYQTNGYISSPNYPDDYYPGADCYYTIQGGENERIEMTFSQFSLQDPTKVDELSADRNVCDTDFLEIFSGLSESLRLCGTLHNVTSFGQKEKLESSTTLLKLRFHSDLKTETQGFKAFWRTISGCENRTLSNTSGEISSVNYPDNYLNNQFCTTTLSLPRGYYIRLAIEFFHVQPLNSFKENCTSDEDHLQIGENDRLCGLWISDKDEATTMVLETNELNLTFFSNEDGTGPGYRIFYSAVTQNRTKDDCLDNSWLYENNCFQLIREELQWNDANNDCRNRSGHLAIISSGHLQSFLNAKLQEISQTKEKGFWIGASDLQYESDFTWLDGTRINFTKWFPGWPDFWYYNKQPNDDGLSGQNCLEMRRKFSYPSKGYGFADEFYWNDITCTHAKPYICQYPKFGSLKNEENGQTELFCNQTISLTSTIWHAPLYSPNYPAPYEDFLNCYIVVNVPEKSWLILEFTKFVLEAESNCEYDYLEIWEEGMINGTWSQVVEPKRICGDWSYRLKLLRRIVANSQIVMHFRSDHSRGFGGYHANVYLEDTTHRRSINVCNNKKLRNFASGCYLFISFPRVEWETASQICKSSGGHLASSLNKAEEHFLVEEVLRSHEYTSDDFFWLGGRLKEESVWTWEDKNDFNYTDFFVGSNGNVTLADGEDKSHASCLALQQQFQTSDLKANSFWIADKLYWSGRDCKNSGGYICKLAKPVVSEGENRSIVLDNEIAGRLTLPGYPSDYPNNFDYAIYIIAQPKTRILIQFTLIDTEYQERCLYDYIQLRTFETDDPHTYCGHIEKDLPDFASYANQAVLNFHSDYSITATGFAADWQVVNISNCIVDTDEPQGYINSVNFPHFYLNALKCETTIHASDTNARILLDFVYFDVGQMKSGCLNTDYVSVHLDGDVDRSTAKLCGKLNTANESRNIVYVSFGNVLKVTFFSDDHLWGVGYRAFYKTLNDKYFVQNLKLKPNETAELKSVNYPRSYPPDLCVETAFRVDYGYQISLAFDELYLTPESPAENTILLSNPLSNANRFNQNEKNGTTYSSTVSTLANGLVTNFTYLSPWNRVVVKYCGFEDAKTANIRRFKSTVSAISDPHFWSDKALKNFTGIIDSCNPNPCHNEFDCFESEDIEPYCKCSPSYLGLFCHYSVCHFEPCQHGKCAITHSKEEAFICICEPEYTGKRCEFQIYPCASNPCQNGDCIANLGEFTCRCNDGYKGDFCEKKALFEAKTLRESFLRDPFWLGLFMILGVMSTVGIVNCCRKKCADTKMSLLYTNPSTATPRKAERIINYEDDKDLLRRSSLEDNVANDDDSEICFSFADLGIDTSQFNSLLQLGDVNFKIKLNELTEEQTSTLESYLENYLRLYEQTNGNNNNDDKQMKSVVDESGASERSTMKTPCGNFYISDHHQYHHNHHNAQPTGSGLTQTGLLVDIGDACSPQGDKSLADLGGNASHTKSSETLNQALDSITELILKSAEIVRPCSASFNVADASPKQRLSIGGSENPQRPFHKTRSTVSPAAVAAANAAAAAEAEDQLYETKQARQRFRGVSRALMMVKRPQSVEISREHEEEMKKLCYRGASSFSIGRGGRTNAFDEETFA